MFAKLTLADLSRLTNGLYKNFIDLEALAQSTLQEANRVGNGHEQASVLTVLASLAKDKGANDQFAQCYQKALEIYRKLNRPDLCRQLKKRFESHHALVFCGVTL